MQQLNYINPRSLKNKKQIVTAVFSLVLFFCIVKSYMAIFQANLNLVNGRFALFMDEMGLYDGVKNILSLESLQTFFFSVVDGGTQVYGRVFWNINAMVGFLPNHFLGPPGLIFSGRTTGVLFLSFSYFLLSIAFLKNWFFRLVSFRFVLDCRLYFFGSIFFIFVFLKENIIFWVSKSEERRTKISAFLFMVFFC